jgi:hypothetical protein
LLSKESLGLLVSDFSVSQIDHDALELGLVHGTVVVLIVVSESPDAFRLVLGSESFLLLVGDFEVHQLDLFWLFHCVVCFKRLKIKDILDKGEKIFA